MLQSYFHQFSNLHRNKLKGEITPHKPIMLLSVMDLIEAGFITSNKIELSEMLEERFKSNWKRYVKTDSVYKPAVGTPFWHLNYEPSGILFLLRMEMNKLWHYRKVTLTRSI